MSRRMVEAGEAILFTIVVIRDEIDCGVNFRSEPPNVGCYESLDADAVQVWAGAEGVCIGARCGAGQAGDAGLNGGESGWRGEVRRALEEISAIGDALPGEDYAGRIGGSVWRKHAKERGRISWVGAGAPFLPIVHVVAIGIGEVGGAVSGKVELLQPGVGDDR